MKISLSPRRMVRVGGNEHVAHSFNIALCDPLLAIVCPFISCWMLSFSFCTNESFGIISQSRSAVFRNNLQLSTASV